MNNFLESNKSAKESFNVTDPFKGVSFPTEKEIISDLRRIKQDIKDYNNLFMKELNKNSPSIKYIEKFSNNIKEYSEIYIQEYKKLIKVQKYDIDNYIV